MSQQRQKIVIAQQQRLALNANLHASIRLLRGDTAGLTRYLEEQVAENPHLRLTSPEAPRLGDWLPRWSGVLTFGTRETAAPEASAASPSLIAHVLGGVQALTLRRETLHIATALVEALEPSGWLGRPLRDIAQDLSLPEDEVEAVLLHLQSLEPTGIFARNLAECLALQAKEAGWLDREMLVILQHLDLLAAGNITRLARLSHCDEAAVLIRFQRIRSLNPKPCSDFTPGNPAASREPDLLARPLKGGRWQITLNRSALPDLEVIEGDKASRDPAALGAAKSLRHMLTARNDTLLKVGREIANRQLAALIQGPAALNPMTMAEVATTLGLHESTISRVVAGASMDSPRGVWWLRQMFSGARGRSEPEGRPGMAATALRHRLTQLIAEESSLAPLSDQALAERLAQETGVALARRTVAKYREMQGIPAATRRRKAASKPR